MKNKKKIITAIVAIIVIILLVVLLITRLIVLRKNGKESQEVNENEVIENNVDNNVIDNEVDENTEVENTTNEITDNQEQTETESTPIVDPEQEVGKQTMEKEESNLEKAMNIAKKDWGQDDSVYFAFEGNDGEKYIISVREKETTYAVRYYMINVDNETFEIQ